MSKKSTKDALKKEQVLLQQELNLATLEKQKAEIILLETKIILLETKLSTWKKFAFIFGALCGTLLIAICIFLQRI